MGKKFDINKSPVKSGLLGRDALKVKKGMETQPTFSAEDFMNQVRLDYGNWKLNYKGEGSPNFIEYCVKHALPMLKIRKAQIEREQSSLTMTPMSKDEAGMFTMLIELSEEAMLDYLEKKHSVHRENIGYERSKTHRRK